LNFQGAAGLGRNPQLGAAAVGSMKNTGKEYELIVEQVFAKLLAQGGICTEVQRNVVLKGIATDHEIDVTFEFRAGPTVYRTIVQCKDWATKVKQEQVLAFWSVITDIPGQPRGIIVSRAGFQEGARKVAERHGIKLYELRAPRDDDWSGLVRKVVTEARIRIPSFENVRLVYDEDVIKREMLACGLRELEFAFEGDPQEIPLTFEAGGRCDLNAVLNDEMRRNGHVDGPIRHDFAERLFANYAGCPLPRLPVKAVTCFVRFSEIRRVLEVSIDHMIAYCFRDVLAGKSQFISKVQAE
jgi:hypothetical protein